MAERFKAHAWKVCVLSKVPWVRIPLSPPLIMKTIIPYIFLILAIISGTASNSFAKSSEGFTQLIPSILSAVTIIVCMYALSNVMKTIPIGATYASFAGLTIVATAIAGVFKFNQVPNLYTLIGLSLIVIGVIIVNLLGKIN